jgi:hypothetical protein
MYNYKKEIDAYSAIFKVDIIRSKISVTEILSRGRRNSESRSLLIVYPRFDI